MNFLPLVSLLLFNVSNQNVSESLPFRANTATITILGPDGKTTLLPSTSLDFEPGETVLDLSIQALKANQIPFELGGSGSTRYIVSIDQLSPQTMGQTSGWLYKVNDNWPSESPALYTLKPNDRITWIYTTNLGQDVGAPSVLFENRHRSFNNFQKV